MATRKKRAGSSFGTSRSDAGESGKYLGEFRGGGNVLTALISGNTFAAKPVQYVEIDGLAIFEGDIVLGTAEEVAQRSDMLRAEMSASSPIAAGVLITGAQFRWPNCRVPFTIDAALPNQQRVTDAIAHWEANTRFRFVAQTVETDFVTFRPGSGCSSSVGRRGGQQFVNLAAGCSTASTIHEIGHVIGLWHEQSRQDRDLFITINWAKIVAGMEHNFNQHITDGDDIGAYDFGSIMHYPRNAFSVDGTDTITPIVPVPAGVTIGQRVGLSAGDIAAANSICAKPKDALRDTRKELIRDTLKEQIKDVRLDTRKELIRDTLKEQIRDTLKEGVFDPGPTLAENVITPGRPPLVRPGVVTPGFGGVRPFAVVTPQATAEASETTAGLQDSIAQLDAQLQQIADEMMQTEAASQSLQEQYNETSALLAQLMQEHDQSTG